MARFRRLFRFPRRTRDQITDEIDLEVQFHLDMRTQELIGEGMSPTEARREARRQFGDLQEIHRRCGQEDVRLEVRRRVVRFFDELWQDARWATRALLRSPGFTVPAVGTLALALAATAIVTSFVRFIVFQPTALSDPERTVFVLGHDAARPETDVGLSYADIEEWRLRTRSLESIGAYTLGTRTLASTGEPRRLYAVVATPNLMSVTGTPNRARTPAG